MLDGLQSEGEAAVKMHLTLAADVRALARAHAALADGKPLPLALREAGIWGTKEKLFERALPQLSAGRIARLLDAACVCNGIVKGLEHPDWPHQPWHALQRWVLMMLQAVVPAGRAGLRLALHA